MPPALQPSTDAQRAMEAHTPARSRRLARLEAFVDGTQYDTLASFWNDGAPLLERAPCIVFTLAEEAIRSHASMVVGAGRFPRLTTHGDEDDTDVDPLYGLSADESAVVDPFLCKIAKQTRFQPTARRLLERALGCGTAVAVVCARGGRLAVDTLHARQCTPTFDPAHPGVITSLEVRYPYYEEMRGAAGRPELCCMLYRRVIDAQRDVTYAPVMAPPDGAEPHWTEAEVHEHGLGFAPVLWYKCLGDDATAGAVDGRALHGRLLDELYALDLARSQLHRASITTLDPIMVEIGVDGDSAPAPLIDQARLVILGADPSLTRNSWGQPGRGQPTKGRKRAPGMAYSYSNENTKVSLLTLPGDALDAGFKNADGLESKICDLLHYRPLDPKTMQSSALSGRAMEWLNKRQIDFDNELRTDFGDGCILPLMDLLLRVALTLSARGAGLYLPGLAAAAPILARFDIEQRRRDGSVVKAWMPPAIDLVWPPYFPATDADAASIGAEVRKDLEAGIITLRTAVEKRAAWYGISNIGAYVEALEEEEGERRAALHDAARVLTPPSTPPPPLVTEEDGEGPKSGPVELPEAEAA